MQPDPGADNDTNPRLAQADHRTTASAPPVLTEQSSSSPRPSLSIAAWLCSAVPCLQHSAVSIALASQQPRHHSSSSSSTASTSTEHPAALAPSLARAASLTATITVVVSPPIICQRTPLQPPPSCQTLQSGGMNDALSEGTNRAPYLACTNARISHRPPPRVLTPQSAHLPFPAPSRPLTSSQSQQSPQTIVLLRPSLTPVGALAVPSVMPQLYHNRRPRCL
mmetsp:Transcript_11383/g.22546  ORF Transcript_11383/g.22546 Transcript_11383/m.22546 type:complete len:223 (+) Transcript_11383:1-669(+)